MVLPSLLEQGKRDQNAGPGTRSLPTENLCMARRFPLPEPEKDYKLWQVCARMHVDNGQVYDDTAFSVQASHTTTEPWFTILHLRKQGQWNQPLPQLWRELQLRLSSSEEFNEDGGGRPGPWGGSIEDTLSREVVEMVTSKQNPHQHSTVEITHSSIRGPLAYCFDYVFDFSMAHEWTLADVVVTIQELEGLEGNDS